MGADHANPNLFVSVLILGAVFGTPIFLLFTFSILTGNARQKKIIAAKAAYDAALAFLRENPRHPDARKKCLEAGRLYYGFIMPNTSTKVYQRGILVGVTDQQNNAASREARISADIEAEIGHLKIQQEG